MKMSTASGYHFNKASIHTDNERDSLLANHKEKEKDTGRVQGNAYY